MFIPARSQRMKAGSKQRLLQKVSNRSLSTIGLLQRISALEIRVLRPTLAGMLCVLIIVIVTLMLNSQLVVQIHSLVFAGQSTVVILSTLLLWRHLQHALEEASGLEQLRATTAHELQALRQAVDWQYELADIATCMSLEELQRRATSHSLAISGTAPQQLPGHPDYLADIQAHALQMLSTVVALRSSALEGLVWREQQRMALDTLWQIAGLLRIPGAAQHNLLHEPLTQLARALDLDWVVLLAPGLHAPIAPVLTVFGRSSRGATLSPSQLRVATEALRNEQPLVRPEGPNTFACLPVLRVGHAPMVMVAHGASAEEATQSILLLLGDLLAYHYEQAYEQANELGA